MQYAFGFIGPGRLVEVHRRLLKVHVQEHGTLGPWVQLDSMTQMVHAMPDERTRDAVSKRAFRKLSEHFGQWDGVLNSSFEILTTLIQPVTFADRKATQTLGALEIIRNTCGALTLDFLRNWPTGDTRSWLERLPGVGPKVSAAVLNFSTLNTCALVIDSYYKRVAKRLGLVTLNAGDRVVARSLAHLVPHDMATDDMQQHYFPVKSLGQTVCHTRSPNCLVCPLRDMCNYARSVRDGG